MLFREGTVGESSQSKPPKVGPERRAEKCSRPDGCSRYRALRAAQRAEFRWYRVLLRPDFFGTQFFYYFRRVKI